MSKTEEEVVETVKEHCKHKDCVYRMHVSMCGYGCGYLLYTDKPRGCKISECDKYRTGRKLPISKHDRYTWMVEEYEDDDI